MILYEIFQLSNWRLILKTIGLHIRIYWIAPRVNQKRTRPSWRIKWICLWLWVISCPNDRSQTIAIFLLANKIKTSFTISRIQLFFYLAPFDEVPFKINKHIICKVEQIKLFYHHFISFVCIYMCWHHIIHNWQPDRLSCYKCFIKI